MPAPLMMYTKKQNSSSRREEQVYDDLPLQIATMDGNVFDGQVQSVSCRTIHGDLAILARHMNYCTAIGMGTAHVVLEDGTERKAACIGGMLTMINGECRLIPTTWEWSEDIDVARAEEAKRGQKIN